MGIRALELFQGVDWLTYRASVAAAYDTLDRMQEIVALPPQAGTERVRLALAMLRDFVDDLAQEMDVLAAELAPFLENHTDRRWATVEIRHHLDRLRTETVSRPARLRPALAACADALTRLKELLRRIDC